MNGPGEYAGGGWLTRLAEAEAGLPDEEAAARVVAAAGPGSGRVLAGLAATRADLAAVPVVRMPPAVAARLAAGFDAIDREAEPGNRHCDNVVHQRVRRRRPLLLTAAAAALVAVAVIGPSTGPAGEAVDPASAAARVLAEGTLEVGELRDPATLAACLEQAGAEPPRGPLLAGRPVVVDGRRGTLLVVGTGVLGRVRAVVPAEGCAAVLADLTTGG
ncbi:hypothetical protein LWC35_23750 [Pseudonocardia kujensis]|uniref:hypothetical protein n=1 Tax=Pseudonocardia kujensis TaxID=1128675 RepID=UPI001E3B7B17|nr:hypothetical protein [Pseudonocardia kujensis]MCE0765899.1 hypothetical protein [Pseudonocardia kujensis]